MPGLKNRMMDQTRRQINRRLRIEVCCVVKINNHTSPDDKKFNTVDVIMRDRVAKADEYRFRKQVVVSPSYLGGHCMGATRSPRVGDVVLVLFYGDREAYVMGPAWSWAEHPVCRPTPYDIADKGGQWMKPFQDAWGDFPKQPYPEIKKPYCFRWFHGPVTGTTGPGRDWCWLFDYCQMGDCTPSCKDCKTIDSIQRLKNQYFKFYSEETESRKAYPYRAEFHAYCGSFWMFESKNQPNEEYTSEVYTEGEGYWTLQGAKIENRAESFKGHIRHSPNGTMEGHSATPTATQEDNVGNRWKVYSPDDTIADQHGHIAAELINLEKKALVRIYKDGSIRVRSSTDVTGAAGKSEVFLGVDGHCWLWNLVDDTYIEFLPGGACEIKGEPITLNGNVIITESLKVPVCTHTACSCGDAASTHVDLATGRAMKQEGNNQVPIGSQTCTKIACCNSTKMACCTAGNDLYELVDGEWGFCRAGVADLCYSPDGLLHIKDDTTTHLLRRDADGTWTDLGGLCLSVSAASATVAYAIGTDEHIWININGTWACPEASTAIIDISVAKDGTLYAIRKSDKALLKLVGSSYVLVSDALAVKEISARDAYHILGIGVADDIVHLWNDVRWTSQGITAASIGISSAE